MSLRERFEGHARSNGLMLDRQGHGYKNERTNAEFKEWEAHEKRFPETTEETEQAA